MNNALNHNDASWIRDLWIGSFTGICGSALLWDNQHKRELWPHFGRLRAFVAGYDFDESEYGQKGWIPFHDYDKMHYEDWERKPGIVDLFYLRSPDKNSEIFPDSVQQYLAQLAYEMQEKLASVTENSNARIYPNPAEDFVMIELPLNASSCRIDLLSCTGLVVRSVEFFGTSYCLDLSDICSGLYILHLTYNQRIETFKLVVQ